MKIITDDPASRRTRARRVATRLEADCAAMSGRADLLLHAAWQRFAAGDIDLARAQVETLLARVDDDPGYAPVWLARQARDLLVLLDRYECADSPAEPILLRPR